MKSLSVVEIDAIVSHHILRKHSKSGGHGGQHVNKKQTKAEGFLDVRSCDMLDAEQKNRLYEKYHNHMSKDGRLRLTCQEQRKYHQNLEVLKKHFKVLLKELGNDIVFSILHHKRHRKH